MTATPAQDVRAAVFRPQGTCPKPWVASVNGVILRDRRSGWRRFKTPAAALKAAIDAPATASPLPS